VDVVLGLVVVSLATTLVLMDRFVLPAFAKMFADFGSEGVLPTSTRIVLSHASTLGGTALSVMLAGLGVFARTRRANGAAMGLLLGGIAIGLLAVAFSFYGLYAPVFDVAGKIKP
jgi:type II secretory pathway component PulF